MKKSLKKAAAVGLTLAMALTSIDFGGLSVNAGGLPTTDGHDKYVNKAVFDVIGSDTFGTKELENPLFDKTKGNQNITELQVPTLAYDDTSVGLVWQKPEKYDNVADYKVWINGEPAGTARENYKVNAAWANKYMESFYDYYNTQGKSDVEMVNVDIHCYRATGLKPDTEYTFKVVAVDADGKELGEAQTITQRTTKTPEVVNIKDFGAETSEGYTSYNDEINAFVEKNTKAIQAAIDACPAGGKVVVPEGIFVTGAVWLKSDMTLEVNGTLWASPNSDHFEIGFLMYPFYTDTRGWGLVNAMTADEANPITNVRVTGTGTLYGNGWKYGAGSTVYKDGYTSNKGVNTQAGDPTDTAEWGLPRYCGSNNSNVFYHGIQSKDSSYKWLKNTGKYTEDQLNALLNASTASEAAAAAKQIDGNDLKDAYATRSSLLIMRNCENVYVGDITIENPSNHSVNILDSRNIATTNVKVFSFDGNNGDGLGFGCSQNVICWANFTDTGDDNLGFGASVGEGARDCDIQTNSEVWMFDNFLREGHGGLAAGSHTGNGIQDVLFEDTVMNHIDMAFRFKSAPTNGGFGANITMRDCAVADTNQGFVLTTSYSDSNSASTTEYAEIGEFYNFAAYNMSMYGLVQNTIQVLADVDPVGNPQKPLHSHHNLYFQDITFGNVGGNGSYKNKNGWETLIGCENAVFYNFKTVSYNSKAVSKKTDKAWNNIQYCNNLVFQGTTWDSVGAQTDYMRAVMSGINVADNQVKAEMFVDDTPDVDPDTGETWRVKADDCKGFFNEADPSGKDNAITKPKLEAKDTDPEHNIGYLRNNVYDGKSGAVGFAYPDCEVTNLTKLILACARQTEVGTQTVSIRLDSKDGTEIAKTTLTGAYKEYIDVEMDVTLPQGVSGAHDLYVVFNSTGDTVNKYIANVRSLYGVCEKSSGEITAPESVDLSNGLVAGKVYNENSAIATVEVLEDTPVNEASKTEPTVTVDGVTYTQFIQAQTAANAGGSVPDNGTATFVVTPKVDCSVTFISKATSKVWWFVESADGINVTAKGSDSTVDEKMTFNLKAGNKYYYYCQGSKPMVYAVILNVPAADTDPALKPLETVGNGGGSTEGTSKGERKVALSWTPVTNDTAVYYGVDTYVDGVKVDMIDGISDPSAVIGRLSSGVTYTFKVYVSEVANSGNYSKSGNNKTLVGETTFKTDGEKDTAAIEAPEGTTVNLANAVYTHAGATWTGIAGSDARIRGYKIYNVSGTQPKLLKTVYNYQIKGGAAATTIIQQAGRLTPGVENKIQVTAFTDTGVEYKYPIASITPFENYDYKAPVFAPEAKVTAAVQANGDVVLIWDAATDDTAVGGYRVYVDGKPVYAKEGDVFNPVNGHKTTEQTTYTIKGLDLTTEHTITIQAGDTWWKAEQSMGDYDKLAGFNWTLKGISTTVGGVVEKADYTAVDAAIARANALTPSDYVDFSGVTKAIEAVVRDLTKDDQAKVDAMAKAITDAIEALVKAEKPSSDVKVETEVGANAPATKLQGSKEDIINKVLTDEEKALVEAGADVTVTISVKDLTSLVSSADQAAIAKVLGDFSVGQYIDITVSKKIGENAPVKVGETSGKLTLTITIPESLKNTDATVNRSYQVVRVHNGVATVMGGTYDEKAGTLTIESDQFSTYAIIYKDTAVSGGDNTPGTDDNNTNVPDDGSNTDKTPQTGDSSMMFLFLALLALSGGVVVYDSRRRKMVRR